MILNLKIDCECVGDIESYGGRDCEGKITKECFEDGAVCEFLCTDKVITFESKGA